MHRNRTLNDSSNAQERGGEEEKRKREEEEEEEDRQARPRPQQLRLAREDASLRSSYALLEKNENPLNTGASLIEYSFLARSAPVRHQRTEHEAKDHTLQTQSSVIITA